MVATAEKTKIKAKLKSYQQNPVAFLHGVLDSKRELIWPKMVEMCESVRDHKKTAVKAGHGVSKTYTAARVALWFLLCHPPATVITTAPTHTQVEELLWREIRLAHTNARIPVGGKLTLTELDFQKTTGLKWFALGFATKPDTVTQEATRFQGYHNEHVLVIFDEAAGILPQIWKAADSLLAGGFCRFLVIGNMTSPLGDFANCFDEDSEWHQITISVLDTPNYQHNRTVIPGVSGREYEQDMANKHGIDSNEYKIRVLGEIPEYQEGTYYGEYMARAKREGRICCVPWQQGETVYTFWDIGDIYTAIWFVQFIQNRLHIIDYYEDNEGIGLPGYARVLFQEKPYVYGGHYAPPDIAGSNRKSFQTGKATLDAARALNIGFEVVDPYSREDGITAVRGILSICYFDEEHCHMGIQCLNNYRKKKNQVLSEEGRPVYHEEPIHDWASHGATGFETLAMSYRYKTIGGKHLGFSKAIPASAGNRKEYDWKRWGVRKGA